MTSRKRKSAAYRAGHGKLPLNTRFRKGRLGNPGRRRPRMATEGVRALGAAPGLPQDQVKEGRRTLAALPAIRAILRSQVDLGTKANVTRRALSPRRSRPSSTRMWWPPNSPPCAASRLR